jgi:hypothetical protein
MPVMRMGVMPMAGLCVGAGDDGGEGGNGHEGGDHSVLHVRGVLVLRAERLRFLYESIRLLTS